VRNSANRSGSRSSSGGHLERALVNPLNPATHEERDYQNSLTQFYSLQLCDANKTIKSLQERINQLQNGNQLKVTELKGKVTGLMIKNQALKSKIEFMQINPSMFIGHNTSFSQPLPFQTRSSSFSPSATSNQLGKGPSGSHFDPSLNHV
jgi:hypothetical protein